MSEPLARIEEGNCAAEIYESALPGQFTIKYVNASGAVLQEEELSGVSTYRQRKNEIVARLSEICSGEKPKADTLSDSGEY